MALIIHIYNKHGVLGFCFDLGMRLKHTSRFPEVFVHLLLTREEEKPTLHGAGDGLQFDHVHRLSDVDRTGHAPQCASHVLRHLLNSEHLQQLVKDVWETVQQRCLRGETMKRGRGRR